MMMKLFFSICAYLACRFYKNTTTCFFFQTWHFFLFTITWKRLEMSRISIAFYDPYGLLYHFLSCSRLCQIHHVILYLPTYFAHFSHFFGAKSKGYENYTSFLLIEFNFLKEKLKKRNNFYI